MKPFIIVLWAVALTGFGTAGVGQQISFEFEDVAKVHDLEIDYRVDLGLRVLGITRLEIDALLDLRNFQKKLPGILEGQPILELCGNDTILTDIDIVARGADIAVEGELQSIFFRCVRIDEANWQRQAEKSRLDFSVTTAVTSELRDNCVFFRLIDLEVQLPDELAVSVEELQNLARVKALLIEAIGLILNEAPFCPDLPPELNALDPLYETAGPQEILDGGIGVAFRGSVNTSASTILGILKALQREGALPESP